MLTFPTSCIAVETVSLGSRKVLQLSVVHTNSVSAVAPLLPLVPPAVQAAVVEGGALKVQRPRSGISVNVQCRDTDQAMGLREGLPCFPFIKSSLLLRNICIRYKIIQGKVYHLP